MTAIPAMKPPIAQPERRPPGARAGDVATHLADHLQRGAGRQREEHDAEHVVRRRSRRSTRPGSPARPRPRRAAPAGRRDPLAGADGGDPETLRDVVDHEADDQERAELQRPEGERRSDREALAEVVDADPDGDEQRQRARRWRPCRGRADDERNVIPSPLAATPSSTRPGPPSAAGSVACSSNASTSASTPRKVSRPAVSARNAASQRSSARRSDGSQSRPSAIGTTPTRNPTSA